MSGLDKPSFPLELNEDGTIKLTPVLAYATTLLPGAIMVSFRCASSAEALSQGGDSTVQLPLSLVQVQDLIKLLSNAELVLRNAERPASVTH